MKKIITMLVLTFMVGTAHATISSTTISSAGFDKLTEQQKAEVIKQITDRAANNVTVAPQAIAQPEDVERWAKIGTSVAAGLGAAAKELNVGVNEFAKTPVGQITTVLIVWKVIGNEIVHIITGLTVMLIGGLSLKYLVNKQAPTEYTYSTKDKNIFGNFVVTKVTKTELSGDATTGFAVGIILVIAFAALIML